MSNPIAGQLGEIDRMPGVPQTTKDFVKGMLMEVNQDSFWRGYHRGVQDMKSTAIDAVTNAKIPDED